MPEKPLARSTTSEAAIPLVCWSVARRAAPHILQHCSELAVHRLSSRLIGSSRVY